MVDSKHTPGPWKWKGEDYRGDWGWQILVGSRGEGIIVGGDGDEPSLYLKSGMPISPELCITGIASNNKPHVNAVHVYSQANARLIAAAPELLELAYAFLGLSDQLNKITKGNPRTKEYIEKAKAVITKATG